MLSLLFWFIVCMTLLVVGSNYAINNSIRISQYIGISELAAGYILIAFSTSLPDLMVSINAALVGDPGIVLGDVFGSTIANICLVLGVAALIRRVRVQREHMLESAEVLFVVSILPLILLSRGILGFVDGLVLLSVFVLYCIFLVKDRFTMKIRPHIQHGKLMLSVLGFFASIIFVIISAKYVITLGREIAHVVGVPDILIGFTLIAFGTTLPELSLNFTAIRRGHTALAVGDILGSCIINLTLVLGTSALITDLTCNFQMLAVAVSFLVGSTVFFWYLLVKHDGVSRAHGLIFVLIYIVFLLVITLTSVAE